MQPPAITRSRSLGLLAIIATLFGLFTLVSGGHTLFNAEAQQQVGSSVALMLWFNRLAGFAYLAADVGLWYGQRWSMWLALAIAAATLLMFAAFGVQIWRGGNYEMRTVAAMGVRTLTWLVIAAVAYVQLAHTHTSATA